MSLPVEYETQNKRTYAELIYTVGNEDFQSRINTMSRQLEAYIEKRGLKSFVSISSAILHRVVLDYYDDIWRLKDFQDIVYTNDVKIHAYMAFWLLRHKPLQVICDNNGLEFINEKFVSEYLSEFILQGYNTLNPDSDQYQHYIEFVKTLNYTFKYRRFDAQSIELALTAFNAGVRVALMQNSLERDV